MFPAVHTLSAPYTLALFAPDGCAILLSQLCRWSRSADNYLGLRCNKPPNACLRPHPPALLLPPLSLHQIPAAAIQFLQAQYGTRAPSPDHHSDPEIPGSRPPANASDRPYDINALHLPRCTGQAQTSPPSTLLAADTRALHSALRYTLLPLLPPALLSSLHPAHTSAGLQSVSRSAV